MSTAINYPGLLDTDDTLFLVTDVAQTVLSSGVTNVDTEFPVVSTSLFPDSGILWIGGEIVQYASKDSTNFLDVTRGIEDTSAIPHVENTFVELRVCAAHHNVLKNAAISLEKSVGTNIKSVSTNYSIINERYVAVDATSGNVLITLPTASGSYYHGIKKIDSSVNTVTVSGTNGELIEGSSTKTLSTQYQHIELVSNQNNAWLDFT